MLRTVDYITSTGFTYPRHGVWKALRCTGRWDERQGTSLLLGSQLQPQLQPLGEAERGTRPRGEIRQQFTWPVHHYCPCPCFLFIFIKFYKVPLSSKLFCRYYIVLCIVLVALFSIHSRHGRKVAGCEVSGPCSNTFAFSRRFPEGNHFHTIFCIEAKYILSSNETVVISRNEGSSTS